MFCRTVAHATAVVTSSPIGDQNLPRFLTGNVVLSMYCGVFLGYFCVLSRNVPHVVSPLLRCTFSIRHSWDAIPETPELPNPEPPNPRAPEPPSPLTLECQTPGSPNLLTPERRIVMRTIYFIIDVAHYFNIIWERITLGNLSWIGFVLALVICLLHGIWQDSLFSFGSVSFGELSETVDSMTAGTLELWSLEVDISVANGNWSNSGRRFPSSPWT